MSSPYSQSHLLSSSSQMHSQVERKTTVPPSDPQPIPPHITTPMPTFVAQPSPSRPPIPSSSAPLVQSSRLPLRKRPAKDQKPVHPPPLQWQPIETAKTTASIPIEPYIQKPEFLTTSFESHSAAIHGGSSYTESLGWRHDSIEFNYHQQDQAHNDKYHTNSFSLNSPSPHEPTTPSLLSSIIPPKPIIHKQKQQQQQQQQQQPSLKKKHNTGTDENDRPIKKTKRGRPPLSSSTAKPLSSHTTTNKTNLGTSDPNTSSKDTSSNNSKPLSESQQPTTSSNTKHTSMLYCLCRKPYDESQFMIACDRCEEWFHGECIGVDEKQGEFVDSYYCADCVKASGKQTSWKPKCSNPTCQKPARTGKNQHAHLSKYCSGACGMQVARERLASSDQLQRQHTSNNDDGNDDNSCTDTMSFTTRMEQLSNSRLSLFADRDDRLRLTRIRGEKRRAIDTINSMNLKQQFLQALIKAVEQDRAINDYCGFDSRLLWDDEQWDGVTGVTVEPTLRLLKSNTTAESQDDPPHNLTVCHQKSKRCQRHNGWIKLKTTELEQERDEQFVVLSILARERKLIKTRMNNRLDEMNVARSLMNGTLSHYQ